MIFDWTQGTVYLVSPWIVWTGLDNGGVTPPGGAAKLLPLIGVGQ